MPIRASDKCRGESVCLLFEEYMELLFDMRNRYETVSTSNSSHFTKPLLKRSMMSSIIHEVNLSFPILEYKNVTSKRTGQSGTIAITKQYNDMLHFN